MNEMHPLRPSRVICSKYWGTKDNHCVGCPVFSACSTWFPTTEEAIKAYVSRVDNAARGVFEKENETDDQN